MAPSKSLLAKIKVKPIKPLDLGDDIIDPPETIVYGQTVETVVLPPVTAKERAAWAKARALQRTDENGQPAEGWAARLAAMLKDGRLYEVNGRWYQRDP